MKFRIMCGFCGLYGYVKMSKDFLKILKRLLVYVFKEYKLLFFIVVIIIIISFFVNVIGIILLKNLIDDYIVLLLNIL